MMEARRRIKQQFRGSSTHFHFTRLLVSRIERAGWNQCLKQASCCHASQPLCMEGINRNRIVSRVGNVDWGGGGCFWVWIFLDRATVFPFHSLSMDRLQAMLLHQRRRLRLLFSGFRKETNYSCIIHSNKARFLRFV